MRPLILAMLAGLAAAPAAAAVLPVTVAAQAPAAGTLVLPLANAGDLARVGTALDAATQAAVSRALTAAAFDYKAKSTLSLRGIGTYDRLLIVGLGAAPTRVDLQNIGGIAAREAGKDKAVALVASHLPATAATDVALGYRLGSYSFDAYKKPEKPVVRAPLTVVGAGNTDEQASVAEAVAFTRDLVAEPANIIYPESFVERTRAAFAGVGGVKIEVLDVPAMEKLGMGAILSVGKGSTRPPRMLIVEYKGAGAPAKPIVLPGKGITFDSGGISIKPGTGMWRMKNDMAGAASVVGAVLALSKARAPVNVVAIAALAENMPDGNASRPGDVVRAMNGKTIEIISTDAEGRLVLADAMVYAKKYDPAAIVDLATLTGAVGGALGNEYAGLFSRQDWLADQLIAAGKATGEELWRLPLHPNHLEDVKSDYADIRNSTEGNQPGASHGAVFIGYFGDPKTPWAHLDIASMAMSSEAVPTVPKGATGYGVQLLDRFVRDFKPGN
ncbi:leucyl aminopeptidase [Sphingoaurantiacus capsulatus]|uniref:Probable cytosol aminopeptidase n=1 Tax=Sphingoaurantiacus capsulatus TaxID=1771310 RepID=A0ABV7X6U8_9SPHN